MLGGKEPGAVPDHPTKQSLSPASMALYEAWMRRRGFEGGEAPEDSFRQPPFPQTPYPTTPLPDWLSFTP
jgi:hypothetical protein